MARLFRKYIMAMMSTMWEVTVTYGCCLDINCVCGQCVNTKALVVREYYPCPYIEPLTKMPRDEFRSGYNILFSQMAIVSDRTSCFNLLKAGGVCRRFVSRAHMRSWLLLSRPYSVVKKGEPCDPITPETKGVYLVQPRIWKVIDGTLYKPVVELVFRRILTYLMIHPGSTVRAICDFFNPDLLPVAVLDVLDILEELKCVKILQFAKVERSSLFSSPEPAKTQDGVHWLKDSDAAVEVLMDAPLRLGYFIEAVKQHQPSQQGLVEEQQS